MTRIEALCTAAAAAVASLLCRPIGAATAPGHVQRASMRRGRSRQRAVSMLATALALGGLTVAPTAMALPKSTWTPQITIVDCSGETAYDNDPSDLNTEDQSSLNPENPGLTDNPGADAVDSNGRCQNYELDLYEHWNPATGSSAGCITGNCDGDDDVAARTDITSLQVAGDVGESPDNDAYYYFRIDLRGELTSTDVSNAANEYQLDIDVDANTTGGDDRPEFVFRYQPTAADLGVTWVNPDTNSDGQFCEDTNNDVGGVTNGSNDEQAVLSQNDNGSNNTPNGTGNAGNGFNLEYTNAQELGNIFVRIPTAGTGAGTIEIAIKKSFLDDSDQIRVRAWARQTSSLNCDLHYYNDHFKRDELKSASSAQDNTGPGNLNFPGNEIPVAIGAFLATRLGDDVEFEWTSVWEMGNAGFNLYSAESPDGEKVRLNDALIAPERSNSFEPQDYVFYAEDVTGDVFFIEDVSNFNKATLHGPYLAGEAFDAIVPPLPVDWRTITAEHADKQAQRQARRAALRQWIAARRSGGPVAAQSAALQAVSSAEDSPVLDLRETPLNLGVSADGLCQVRYEAIAEAFDLARVRVRDLAVTDNGKPIPINVRGGRGAFFGPGAVIEFPCQGLDTTYTGTRNYVLSANRGAALRVGKDRSRPNWRLPRERCYWKEATFERNNDYNMFAPADADPWYDTEMLVGKNKDLTRAFEVEVAEYCGGDGEIEAVLWGASNFRDVDNDHHIASAALNGQAFAQGVRFDGQEIAVLSGSVTGLTNGPNELSITLRGDAGADLKGPFWSTVAYDQATLRYRSWLFAENGGLRFSGEGALFEVGNLPSRRISAYRIEGDEVTWLRRARAVRSGSGFSALIPGSDGPASYLVASAEGMLQPTITRGRGPVDIGCDGQDIVIISHPDFIDGWGEWIAAKEAEGFGVCVTNVLDVYAQYSGGNVDAAAIQAYIGGVVASRDTETYFVLGGGDNADYRDYLGNGGMSLIPTLFGPVREAGHAPTDDLYCDTDGDRVADAGCYIGRFTARTDEELARLITKSLDYAQGGNSNAVLASDRGFSDDNAFVNAPLADIGWLFDEIKREDYSSAADANFDLVTGLNSSPRLAAYFGHSWVRGWGDFFSDLDAELLTNADPFVAIQHGCWNTQYADPVNESLVNLLLLPSLSGAAAVIGPTAPTTVSADRAFGRELVSQLSKGARLGPALRAAKGVLNPAAEEIQAGVVLLGDPTLQVVD